MRKKIWSKTQKVSEILRLKNFMDLIFCLNLYRNNKYVNYYTGKTPFNIKTHGKIEVLEYVTTIYFTLR